MLDEGPSTISKANEQWVLNLKGSPDGEVWSEPPKVLDRLLLDLFTAKPQDVLSWVHHAVWELRTKELLGKPSESCSDSAFGPVGELHINELRLDFASTAIIPDDYSDDSVPEDMPLDGGIQEDTTADVDNEDADAADPPARVSAVRLDMMPEQLPPHDGRQTRYSVSSINSSVVLSHADEGEDGTGSISSNLNALKRLSNASLVKKALSIQSKQPTFVTTMRSSQRTSQVNTNQRVHTVHWREGVVSAETDFMGQEDPENKDFDEYFGLNQQLNRKGQSLEVLSGGAVAESASPVCVMSPVGRLRMSWDFVFALCFAFDMWSTPFELVYVPHDEDLPGWLQVLSGLVMVIFSVDIVLNFFTGYFKNGSIILDRRLIALNYLRVWFWFDLLATLPALVLTGFGNAFITTRFFRSFKAYKLIKALRLLRALRMTRLQDLASILDRWLGFRPIAFVVHMVYWNVAVAFLAHLNASVWAACQPESLDAQTNDEAFDRYLESLSLAIQAIAVGDGMPSNADLQRVINIIVCLVHFTFFAVLWRWCLWRVLLLQKEAEQVTMQKQALAYLQHHNVSSALQEKVSQILNESGNAERWVQNFTVVSRDRLPSQLRRTIRCELWCTRLQTLDLVKYPALWNLRFLHELAITVREEVIASEVVVFTAGEHSTMAFKILQGVLASANDECDPNADRQHSDFTAGMWVGEKALLNPELQEIHTIVCKVWSHLMCVEGEKFFALLEQFELKDRFDELLQDYLFNGLCGRCGILGNHFTFACPVSGAKSLAHTHSEEQRKTLSIDSCSTDESDFTGMMVGRTLSMPMTHALSRLQLERLRPLLEKHVIYNVEDITPEALQKLRDDEDADLTEDEWNRLNVEDLRGLVSQLKTATTQVLAGQAKSNHYIFISHYKVESGTEAALMKEDLVRLIQDDTTLAGYHNTSAVFLDTEELRDLNQLKGHVRKSQNLLLLLTPNVLTRPWCLIEIVVAFKAGVQVVPVEVQRAGMSFEYPDEAYYESFLRGDELDAGASRAILAEDFTMEDVVTAMRQVFMRIALPFSPHKTANVRNAELQDILKNCSGKTATHTRTNARASTNFSWVASISSFDLGR